MGIAVSQADGIVKLGFDRLDKKNAITAAMYQSMADAIQAAEQDSAARVMLLHGHPQCFTSGNDIADFLHNPPAGSNSPVFKFLRAISTASKPVLAAVSGAAVGVGTTMLMHCDMVYASDNAVFSMPFVKLGLCPEAASSYLFPTIAGYQQAAEYLLTGDSFDAQRALQLGLVNRVLPTEETLRFAEGQAQKIAKLPVSSIAATKRFMKAGQSQLIAQRMQEEGAEFTRLLRSDEARAAFASFLK
jgi:enoyl-CoA hydratase/carnithine racemase